MRTPPPPVAAVISFIDCVNRGDLEGLRRIMTDDHVLKTFDEEPVTGRDDNLRAWKRYLTSFPNYVIHPRRIAVDGDHVAILGATTGSHLALPDEEELKHTLIWLVHARDGHLARWQILEDTPAARASLGLTRDPPSSQERRNSIIAPSTLGLSLQRALVGEITSDLVGVTAGSTDKEIRIVAYFDGPPSDEDVERIQVASTEVIADFPEADSISEEVRDARQSPLQCLDFWAYLRADYPDRKRGTARQSKA